MKVSFTSLEEAWGSTPLTPNSPLNPPENNKNYNQNANVNANANTKVDKNKWMQFIQNSNKNNNRISANSTRNPSIFENAESYDSNSVYSQDSNDQKENFSDYYEGSITNRSNTFGEWDNTATNERNDPPIPSRKLVIPEECSPHLEHFVNCPYCNRAIRQRLEEFLNKEKKSIRENYENGNRNTKKYKQKMNHIMKKNSHSLEHYDNMSDKMSSNELDMRSDTDSNASIDTLSNNASSKNWNQYIGEIFIFIFIGILFIYLLDFIVNFALKWKK
jgi:hypothetical protein